ncbi:MAG: hypothetical protein P8M79_07950 [Alphaproteobacteria bacterium]|nr:hypothetical protein [Alphaproteobacteria bacterium]
MTKNLVIRSSHLLPWEDVAEYEALVAALFNEHDPEGPTEWHLVEELAGIMWRRQRVSMAEAALHQHGLSKTMQSFSDTPEHAVAHTGGGKVGIDVSDAMTLSQEKTAEQLAGAREDMTMAENAKSLAAEGKYDAAIRALRADTRDWWTDVLEDEEDDRGIERTATAESLFGWLELEAIPLIAGTERGLVYAGHVRNQAYGESLNPAKFNELARWEAHLDRRMEKTLALLLKLRSARATGRAA